MEIFAKITGKIVKNKQSQVKTELFKLIKSQDKFYWSMLTKYYGGNMHCWYFTDKKNLHLITCMEYSTPHYQFSVSKLKTFIPLDHSDLLEENQCNS